MSYSPQRLPGKNDRPQNHQGSTACYFAPRKPGEVAEITAAIEDDATLWRVRNDRALEWLRLCHSRHQAQPCYCQRFCCFHNFDCPYFALLFLLLYGVAPTGYDTTRQLNWLHQRGAFATPAQKFLLKRSICQRRRKRLNFSAGKENPAFPAPSGRKSGVEYLLRAFIGGRQGPVKQTHP